MAVSFELTGLDGANPLGFLAALGTLVSLHETQNGDPKLRWKHRYRWAPILEGVCAGDEDALSRTVAESLRGKAVAPIAETRRAEAEREMEDAMRALKRKRSEIRKRGLGGAERSALIEPLRRNLEEKRRAWLAALRESVPRPELALGRRIDCTPEEYRACAAALAGNARLTTRGPLDMLAAFGSDACRQANSNAVEPTPFCFITGSGHQYFLETARELMARVRPEDVRRVLFGPWDYRDAGYSMRWDPIEDRRYALMDRDPSPSSNKPRTMWMANLLGYRALALFPTAPTGSRLGTAGWSRIGSATNRSFTWPLWESPLGVDCVRSLLQLRDLVEERPDASALRARGILAVYRAHRVEYGTGGNKKVNFSPSLRVV